MRTYKAVTFEVPRFLDTCEGDARKAAVNKGVVVVEGQKRLIERVVEIAAEHYRKVHVLVITSSLIVHILYTCLYTYRYPSS